MKKHKQQEPQIETVNQDAIIRLTKDLQASVTTMTADEARFLVDSYYQMQANRIRADGQIRSVKDEPHKVLDWLSENSSYLEKQIQRALGYYAEASPVGRWSLSIKGIGPVIAAGLLAHIDITKAPTVGHIWRFGGQDPTTKWEKKTKRPFNAQLKKICWYIGQSFMKCDRGDDSVYGKIYEQRKISEIERNERFEFKEQAAAKLEKCKIDKKTDAYKSYSIGKLPPAHIDARARRYAVKQFLSDWHKVAYRERFKCDPPLPYPISHLGHAHLRELGKAA